MKTDRRILLSGAAILFAVGWADISAAQSVNGVLSSAESANSNFARDRSVSVRQRPHEGYEALGVALGAFTAWPKVTTTLEHNDNVYGSSTNEVADSVWHVQPDVRVTSNWSRHYLEGFARGNVSRYSDLKSENSEDWTVGAVGRVDVHSTFTLNGNVDTGKYAEPRTSANTSVATVEPVKYSLTEGTFGATKEFNRLRLGGRLDLKKFDYDDGRSAAGAVVEQDDRDRSTQALSGRVDYAVSPDTAFFVEVSGNKRNYRLSPPAVTASRDSDGYTVLGGANFEVSALLRGEIGLGYVSQSYDSPTFSDIDGLGARAQVEWFPSELTTVTLTGSRSIEDSGIVGDAGYLSTNTNAQVDHELLRNVILTGQVGYAKDDHKGALPRQDERVTASLGGTYLLNRNVGLTVSYSYTDQSSNLSAFDYKQNKVGASLTFQF